MTPRKYFYILLGILITLILLIIGGAVGGNIFLKDQAKELSSLKAENETIELQQQALVQAKKDVEQYSELEEITKSIVPQDKDQAKTVREIIQIAQENGIPIKSVSFETSTLGDKATPTPGAPGPAPASQLKPVEGIPGVFTLPIQVASEGTVSYQNFLNFLEGLEKNRRTAHVSGINLQPEDDGEHLSFNLTLNAYMRQ